MNKKLLPFENKVLKGLRSCGVNPDSVSGSSPLALAVSGGADSVSMLLSLYKIFGAESLCVITVDHGIRSDEESGGDAFFVRDLCAARHIRCHVEKIPSGNIERLAKSTNQSLEAVARGVRYDAFSSFVEREKIQFICLAHNRNDQAETLLMRFLQGSAGEGMSGIRKKRGLYVRPLLEIPRTEIENYLRLQNQPWRTDGTNADTAFLRNRIRNVLVPLLDAHFSGWQNGILMGAKKSACDEDFIRESAKEFFFESDGKGHSKIRRDLFFSLHDSLKRRLFFSALNETGFGGRFPFSLFEEIVSWKSFGSRSLSFEGVSILLDDEFLEISVSSGRPEESAPIESGFSFLFNAPGEKFEFDGLMISTVVLSEDGGLFLEFERTNSQEFSPLKSEKISFSCSLPFIVRSVCPGDSIETVSGTQKKVSDILSDWKIPLALRGRVLAVEELSPSENMHSSRLKALLAFHIGSKNWIVE